MSIIKFLKFKRFKRALRKVALVVSSELALIAHNVVLENESEVNPWSGKFKEVFKFESMAYLLWYLRINPIYTDKLTNHLFLDLVHEEYFSAYKRNGYNFEQRSSISDLLNDRYREYDNIFNDDNEPVIGSAFAQHLSDSSDEQLNLENALLVVELREKEAMFIKKLREDILGLKTGF